LDVLAFGVDDPVRAPLENDDDVDNLVLVLETPEGLLVEGGEVDDAVKVGVQREAGSVQVPFVQSPDPQ
jgi:hypothetical protein